jgi:hypothetical protein
MSDNKEQLKEINQQLRDLSKQFNDLKALKQEVINKDKANQYREKFGEYNLLVKNASNEEFDLETLLNENDLTIVKSSYGMLCASYKVADEPRAYHLAKNEEEANQVRVVETIFKTGEKIQELIKEKEFITANEILKLYDSARQQNEVVSE